MPDKNYDDQFEPFFKWFIMLWTQKRGSWKRIDDCMEFMLDAASAAQMAISVTPHVTIGIQQAAMEAISSVDWSRFRVCQRHQDGAYIEIAADLPHDDTKDAARTIRLLIPVLPTEMSEIIQTALSGAPTIEFVTIKVTHGNTRVATTDPSFSISHQEDDLAI